MPAMAPLASDDAFKQHAQFTQCPQQEIDTFASDDLARKENQVAIAEGADWM